MSEPEILAGARPVGQVEISPESAADNVREMFNAIAPRYDVLNHVLSGGIDHTWWWRAARAMRPMLERPETVALDLCCGTGDMTRAMLKLRPSTPSTEPMIAVDFSHNMLLGGLDKMSGLNSLQLEGDGLHLPVRSGGADLISSAFGFRNLVNYEEGLAELFRVLRPGGMLAILECNQPGGLAGAFYNLYFKRVLPRVGGWLSDAAAYNYLPASVERFPRSPRMLELIRAAGFKDASWTSYTFGIAGLYLAKKP